ncbi:S41 family peptidase [Plebeiibacterium sediminum]|uniref:S41 family peptidase n=1 Tax=Plebeiibacterium sediminum TaxID=2992112 RepID=A0AAE3M9U3_9BACT|nr:S41 family peptidase [Plebeiobacterium sediminum]MCW3789235.1 S41 family peptidase [Plebeiobacterium sediminum]
MIKIIVLFALMISVYTTINAKEKIVKQLTTDQKLAEFDSLFIQLKDVFPYFGVNERRHGVDWLANYQLYRDKIAHTSNDKEYLAQIDSIMRDLNSVHADIYPTRAYKYYLHAYRFANMLTFGAFKGYTRELRKSVAKENYSYWQALYKELHPPKVKTDLNLKEDPNVRCELNEDSSIAVIKIKSFDFELKKTDKDVILGFYNQLDGYKNLIIDIQGNGGGFSGYWQDVLVPFLSDTTITYKGNLAYKDTPKLLNFIKADKNGEEYHLDSIQYPKLPPEVIHDNYAFSTLDFNIKPDKKSANYKGNIYLLVDHNNYSSTEAFVNFCKVTGFATVVGETTGGDGIGSDPFMFTLPISGIVVRYPAIMGLNPDGSSNDEFGTTPDIILNGSSKSERFKELNDYIMNHN